MTLYMAVTPDKYELPLCVSDSGSELARQLGIAPNTIFSSIAHEKSGKNSGRKFVRVEVDED